MYKRGFSFPELIIAVGIFALLSVATVSVYANFNNRTGVDLLAHQIAQFGREAQVSALSVKKSMINNSYPGYGVYFNKASSTSLIFFADTDTDGMYDAGSGACGTVGSECEKKVSLLKGVTIYSICTDESAGFVLGSGVECEAGENYLDSTTIIFKRPSPDARLIGVQNGVLKNLSWITVTIRSAKGYKRSVRFYNTGQVTVKGDTTNP
jgi:prepilin-type N-terminal cleavage/methylation domain-containing protein